MKCSLASPGSALSGPPSSVGAVTTSPATTDLRARADEVLRSLTARDDAAFRDGQWEAVEALVARGERALVVQRTGWGKSAVYFVATALLRAAGSGPTLLVSPLLALMRDQVAAAARAGVRAEQISSANPTEWGEVAARVRDGEVDLLLVSPERLTNPRFRDEVLPGLVDGCGLLVVDEAHCISDWGHDFRPDYRRIRDLLAELPSGTPVLATTATANSRVVDDVRTQLTAGPDGASVPVTTVRGPLARTSLRLGVLHLDDPAARVAWLDAHLDALPGSGIVYALTVSAAEQTAAALRRSGHRVAAYTGRVDDAERRDAEDALRRNEIKALVATSALGMGFDKPDLGFVVHLGSPSSPVSYYQQVGRAGRALERADVLLLPGAEDRPIWDWFATSSMPRQDDADAVLAVLAEAARPLSVAVLETAANVRRSRLELLLKVLAVDGAVRREGSGWSSTGQPWTYDAERYERVAAARAHEAESMLRYQRLEPGACRMAFLQESLDDPTAAPCGRCDLCAGTWFPTDVPEQARSAADDVLHAPGVEVDPRKLWPTGLDRLGLDLRGRIPPEEQVEPGRAVARLTDLGYGPTLRTVLDPQTPDNPLGDVLLQACVRVLTDWDWAQRPAGVVHVPSRARPTLVASIASRIAEVGRLPLLGSLDLVGPGPQGASGGNSAYRLAAIWDRLGVGPELAARLAGLDGAPVLLVDDLTDSRWTLAVAGRALRLAGSGPVLPLVLATAG